MTIRMMVKRIGMFGVIGLLAMGAWGTSVMAGGNPHVGEAISHAEGAVEQGHADALVEHAQEALTHAQAAQKDLKNPHLDEGVHELMEAVEHGNAGHAEVGTKHAKSAVMHLKEVK